MKNNIRYFKGIKPQLAKSLYIDDSAVIIGNVSLGENTSIWPCAVLRGDVNFIEIGDNTNIQDLSVLHVGSPSQSKPEGSPLIIGHSVTIGHRVILHGCRIGHFVLVGMGTCILDDAVIEDEVLIAAGSLVPPGKHLASGFLYMGSPVKAVRALTVLEIEFLRLSALNYVTLAQQYLEESINGQKTDHII